MYSKVTEDDVESGFKTSPAEFAEQTVRLGFIRKVFGLLSVQLLVTFGLVALFMFCKPLNEYSNNNPWLFYTAFGLSLGMILVLACVEPARRVHPWNLIVLFAFTICEGFMLGAVTSLYQTQVVLIALGITVVVVAGVTLFAFQTKWDFTTANGILFSCLLVLTVAGIIQIFVRADWLQILISAGGALLFSVYLIFDIQLLMGGQHKYSISPDEYVFAALNIYLDIINLFLYILSLVNRANNQ